MRLKIFILIAVLFSVAIFGIIGLHYFEVGKSIRNATIEIGSYIKKSDVDKRDNILEYLNISITEIETKIATIFDRIDQLEWIQKRLMPENYEYYADHWQDSSVLMITNPWIDLIQTTAGNKLASSIVIRPPYLNTFIYIPETATLPVIIEVGDKCAAIPYIGVPYWTTMISNSNGKNQKIELQKEDKKEDYLLFTIDDLLTIDAGHLTTKDVRWNSNPYDIFRGIPHKAFESLISNVIESIKLVQAELKNRPELISILNNPEQLNQWIKKKIERDPKTIKKMENRCREKICCGWTSIIKKEPWTVEEGWDSRYRQNQCIWKLGFLFGSGIWNFNPLEKRAPKGLCNFLKTDINLDKPIIKGGGILLDQIIHREIIPFFSDCLPVDSNICSSEGFQIKIIPETEGLFFTKTMIFKNEHNNEPLYGTMTIGVSINELLQQLALIIPGSILCVNESGEKLFFNKNGEISNKPSWGDIDFSKFIHEKTGTIKNIEGREFLFIHFSPILEGTGQVFVIELTQGVFQLLDKLKTKTETLRNKLIFENSMIGIVGLLIALLILNFILKKGIAPLTELATTTKLIAVGKLENIYIPAVWKRRKDEIGVLCLAFDQMVQEMKEGLKVRELLHKVVSKEIANKILKDGVRLGGEIREVTILFADIRGFTQISEHMPPAEVLEMLNSCLNILSKVIDEHKGVIDKYIGDEIMAIFGAPVDIPDQAFQAVMCAKNMIQSLKEWNLIRKDRNLPSLTIGISVHTGHVVAGNMGAENHMSYTIIGHNVNLASRIADHAQGMEILITEETFNSPKVKEEISCERIAHSTFKGISKPILLYKVIV